LILLFALIADIKGAERPSSASEQVAHYSTRKTNWETTDIIVRLSDGDNTSKEDRKPATYSRKNGARQSKRLRQVRENGEKRRLTITRSMSVKEIKIMVSIYSMFPIPFSNPHYRSCKKSLASRQSAKHFSMKEKN